MNPTTGDCSLCAPGFGEFALLQASACASDCMAAWLTATPECTLSGRGRCAVPCAGLSATGDQCAACPLNSTQPKTVPHNVSCTACPHNGFTRPGSSTCSESRILWVCFQQAMLISACALGAACAAACCFSPDLSLGMHKCYVSARLLCPAETPCPPYDAATAQLCVNLNQTSGSVAVVPCPANGGTTPDMVYLNGAQTSGCLAQPSGLPVLCFTDRCWW